MTDKGVCKSLVDFARPFSFRSFTMAINLNQPLDDRILNGPERKFLNNLQANILQGHGRDHVALLFLEIKNIEAARQFLRQYPVTTALRQLEDTQDFRARAISGGLVRLLFLTRLAMQKLNHAAKFNAFGAYSQGMALDPAILDDGSLDSWQTELRKPVDVLLLLASDNATTLQAQLAKLIGDVKRNEVFEVVFVQGGQAYRNSDEQGVEHFGYVDGRSQPLMLQTQIDKEKAQEGNLNGYDPTAPLKQCLLRDPLDESGFGSFFVFRKLEQNVAGFKQREKALADALQLAEADEERAGAMVVGRFEDGTPVTLAAKEEGVPVRNNFNYSADSNGGKCPFQGHIRKTNPRGSNGNLAADKAVQMARRGITYGVRLQDPKSMDFLDQPNDGVGLLFMSYQASIEDQFRFMQTMWANNAGFPTRETEGSVGIDPVIGQKSAPGASLPQTWFPTYDSNLGGKPFLFEGFVKLKGGEYFFAPSISGLASI
jgi:Dyp-type peroxidase family